MLRIPLVFFFLLVVGVLGDDYVDEIHGRCSATRRSYFCAKYNFFKYIDDYSLGNFSLSSDSSWLLVSLADNSANMTSDVEFFETSRQYVQQDSEVVKIWKFLKRRVVKFVQEQGVAMELPEGVEVVEEEERGLGHKRGKKVKKTVLLPFLILLKVFKIKVIVSLILVGVVAIKKMLLAAAFILPGVVAAIKHHCKGQNLHVVPYHVDEEHHVHDHEHQGPGSYGITSGIADYGGGYGGGEGYWDKKKRHSYH